MLMNDESIVIVKRSGLYEQRQEIPAVKCMKFGQYATDTELLPESELLDWLIWE